MPDADIARGRDREDVCPCRSNSVAFIVVVFAEPCEKGARGIGAAHGGLGGGAAAHALDGHDNVLHALAEIATRPAMNLCADLGEARDEFGKGCARIGRGEERACERRRAKVGQDPGRGQAAIGIIDIDLGFTLNYQLKNAFLEKVLALKKRLMARCLRRRGIAHAMRPFHGGC